MPKQFKQFALLTLLLLSSSVIVAGQAPATISGTVRDRHGVPQMGAAVELLGLGHGIVAETMTDLHGRYLFQNMLPGTYQVQATATLFLPATRRQLRVRMGAKPSVDLTLISLFDESQWLPVGPPAADEKVDDWKWTLRSRANRPMLRLAEDGISVPAEASKRSEQHGAIGFSGSNGTFGAAREQIVFTASESKSGGRTRNLLGGAVGHTASAKQQPMGAFASSETTQGFAGSRRFVASVHSLPQLSTGADQRLGVLTAALASGERLAFGDFAQLECGSAMQVVRAGTTLVVQRPFLQIDSAGAGNWQAGYSLATSPQSTKYDDLGAAVESIPTAARVGNRLQTAESLHQALHLRRTLGRGRVEIAYHHDLQHNAEIAGVRRGTGVTSQEALVALSPALRGVMYDSELGLFRALAAGFRSEGYRVEVDLPLADAVSITGALVTGSGYASEGTVKATQPALSVRRSQAVLVAAQTRIARSGTRIVAAYRWQPATMLTVVSPYDLSTISPYLSVHLRQRIAGRDESQPGMELVIDGSNLLQQGYQRMPGANADVTLASALQELRAGLNFTF